MSPRFDFTTQRKAKSLGKFWDATSYGNQPSVIPAEVEPFVDLIDRINQSGSARTEHPATTESGLNRLIAKHQELNQMNTTAPPLALVPSQPSPRSTIVPGQAAQYAPQGRPARTMATIAALLLVSVIGAIAFQILSNRNADDNRRSPAIMAPGTPDNAANGNLLLELPVPADVIPTDGDGVAGIRAYTMPPNSTGSWGGGIAEWHASLWASYIVDGTMTIKADVPTDVIRADGSRETIQADTLFTVATGDTVLHQSGKYLEWGNSESTELTMIAIYVSPEPYVIYPRSYIWVETGFDETTSAALPPGNWVIRVEAIELEPGATVPCNGQSRPSVWSSRPRAHSNSDAWSCRRTNPGRCR